MKATVITVVSGTVIYLSCFLGYVRGVDHGAEAAARLTAEQMRDIAEKRHDQFARCVRRLYNADLPAQHDPVLLCEEQLGSPL